MGTPAEERLTDRLDEAIREYYATENVDGMPAGWVLLINDIGTDGPESSGVQIAYPHGGMPWASALGIVEAGRIMMHASFGRGPE